MEIYKRAPVTVNPVLLHPAERRVALDGSWQFRLDPEDKGLSERWHTFGDLPDTIEVPGTCRARGSVATMSSYLGTMDCQSALSALPTPAPAGMLVDSGYLMIGRDCAFG